MTIRAIALALASVLTVTGSAAGPRFYDDDPIWVEPQTQDASGAQPWDPDLFVDLTYNLFGKPGESVSDAKAQNINSVDQVPDSSWYTNRAGRRTLTTAEITRGPIAGDGPAPGKWIVVQSKSDGVTPGFTIRDAAGVVWFLKFDPPGYRGMATGTEVVVSKLMWALGYHVPEYRISALRRDQLVVGEGATFEPPGEPRRAMRPSDISALLDRAERSQDGSFRIIASRGIDGFLGRFRFHGTRPDDPNDVIAHEHRRELRGLRVFAAWVNHVDVKAINTLDALVKANGRAFVQHHLLDFGAALGSASVAPREHWEGFESVVEPGVTARQMAAFGFYVPKWRTLKFYESPSIGRLPLDNTRFEPEQWKPRVPNPAFLHARQDDEFWAAEKVAALNDELLRAAVKSGEFGDPKSEEFLVKALAERRDAIARTYLAKSNPITNPVLASSGTLSFRNAAVDAGVAAKPESYRAKWFAFDNATAQTRLIDETIGVATSLDAPARLRDHSETFIKVELSADAAANPSWAEPVHAYFRHSNNDWRLVGFERVAGK